MNHWHMWILNDEMKVLYLCVRHTWTILHIRMDDFVIENDIIENTIVEFHRLVNLTDA